jgi:hypothetical protein
MDRSTLLNLIGLLASAVFFAMPGFAGPGFALQAITGKWKWVNAHARMQFQDRNTGAFSRASGEALDIAIQPDGRFSQSVLVQSSLYNCTTSWYIAEHGYVEQQGRGLVFHTLNGTSTYTSSCNPVLNSKKPIPPREQVYSNWRVDQDQNGKPRLCMTLQNKPDKPSCTVRAE